MTRIALAIVGLTIGAVVVWLMLRASRCGEPAETRAEYDARWLAAWRDLERVDSV